MTLRWTNLLTHWPQGGLKALNEEEDVAVEAESICTGPQSGELQTLEDVRDRVSSRALSRNLALRTPEFEPRKIHGGFLFSEVAIKSMTACYIHLQ